MRIALVLPGSGTRFYCENCTRDGDLVQMLRSRGHEVIVCPLYLPLEEGNAAGDGGRAEDGGWAEDGGRAAPPIFYGAINLYLQQRFPMLRRSPPWLERLLDSNVLLRIAGAVSGSTSASGLEELTVSMLKGEEGEQKTHLDRLVRRIETVRPDVLHLSNGLLLGIARPVKHGLGVPVVCSLQDEDAWIDSMQEPFTSSTWELMAERATDVDLFLPVSTYFSQKMQGLLRLPPERFTVVPVGVDPSRMEPHRLPFHPARIGYLAHISESMGFGLLVDAFIELHRNHGQDPLLTVTGGSLRSDSRYIKNQIQKLKTAGLWERVSILPSFDRDHRATFLSSLTALSVPVLEGEALGTFQLDAMAAGVPVVQPALGGFSEVIESTGGGVLYAPNTPEALAAALASLLREPDRAQSLGDRGREGIREQYTLEHMMDRTEEAYRSVCAAGGT